MLTTAGLKVNLMLIRGFVEIVTEGQWVELEQEVGPFLEKFRKCPIF